jgi:hypothetical protein
MMQASSVIPPDANPRYPIWLLRARRERPRNRHAAEQRDELVAAHIGKKHSAKSRKKISDSLTAALSLFPLVRGK